MSSVLDALRALRRAVFKLIRVLFILAMVMLPLPIVMALSVVLVTIFFFVNRRKQ